MHKIIKKFLFFFLLQFCFLNFVFADNIDLKSDSEYDLKLETSPEYLEHIKDMQIKAESLRKNQKETIAENIITVSKYFQFNFQRKDNNEIKELGLSVQTKEIKIKKEDKIEKYKLTISSDKGEILDDFNFSFSKFDGKFTAKINRPYYENAQEIKIYKDNQELYSKDISYLHYICGDNVCDKGETSENCLQDCQNKFYNSKTFKIFFLIILILISLSFIYLGIKKVFPKQ